jgi:SP family general alpha glucoside:H+ symporter-like MFS transporter
LGIAAYLAPESPWFLVRQNRLEDAKKSLQRLSEPEHNINYDNAVALMVHTDKLEQEERAGATYWDALRGTNLRRTEIACMAFMSHITNGGALCYSGSYFFQQVGIKADISYAITLGGKGLCFVGTVLSWFYIHRFGRRTIWLPLAAEAESVAWLGPVAALRGLAGRIFDVCRSYCVHSRRGDWVDSLTDSDCCAGT